LYTVLYNDQTTPTTHTPPLHDALPIYGALLISRIGQHGQGLVTVTRQDYLIKAVTLAIGDNRHAVVITLDGGNRTVQVGLFAEPLHHTGDIGGGAPRNYAPGWTVID